MLATVQPTLFQHETRSASLDRRRIYRYKLWRQWSPEPSRYVNFVCLNPSTADENTDDPTVRKCVKFAQRWGYDALCITNLFAFRATDFKVAMRANDPVGFGNDRHILSVAQDAFVGDLCVEPTWCFYGPRLDRPSNARTVRSTLSAADSGTAVASALFAR